MFMICSVNIHSLDLGWRRIDAARSFMQQKSKSKKRELELQLLFSPGGLS